MSHSTVSFYSSRRWTHLLMKQSTPSLENLAHLASKPGVQSTLILSRSDGSIIHKTGLLTQSSKSSETSGRPPHEAAPTNGDSVQNKAQANDAANDMSAESIAYKVFTFMSQAQGFAGERDPADEVRLLRLRTRRNEVVIIPGSRGSYKWYGRWLLLTTEQ